LRYEEGNNREPRTRETTKELSERVLSRRGKRKIIDMQRQFASGVIARLVDFSSSQVSYERSKSRSEAPRHFIIRNAVPLRIQILYIYRYFLVNFFLTRRTHRVIYCISRASRLKFRRQFAVFFFRPRARMCAMINATDSIGVYNDRIDDRQAISRERVAQ